MNKLLASEKGPLQNIRDFLSHLSHRHGFVKCLGFSGTVIYCSGGCGCSEESNYPYSFERNGIKFNNLSLTQAAMSYNMYLKLTF